MMKKILELNKKLESCHIVNTIDPVKVPKENRLPLNSKLRNGKTRIVCISDTHSRIKNIAHLIPLEADILIHAGDFTMYGDDKEIQEFDNFLGTLKGIKHKIVIAGNHEYGLDTQFASSEEILKSKSILKNCTYLEDNSIEVCGLKIYGSPWQPRHAGNAFQVKRSGLKEIWEKIPTDTDILVTHGPPHGVGDTIFSIKHVGCNELAEVVLSRVKPMYHIFGHIHESYGMWKNDETYFINASICDGNYRASREPIIFDVDLK